LLLALTDGDYPTAALEQCAGLAQSLEADLHVLQVLPAEYHFTPDVPDLDLIQTTRRVERCLGAARLTKAWCDGVLTDPLSAKRLRIRIGDFVEDAASRAAEVDAAFIVLPPSTGRLGATAAALARASSRPVLVARTPLRRAALLAATDLKDDTYWVLRQAVELGARLETPVVAVHNVSCLPSGFDTPSRLDSIQTQALRLVRATEQLEATMETVVATEVDPVDAILDQARARNADVIVVGTRPRGRPSDRSLAAEVVSRSDRSVLITPFTTRN
jgi:nucleotide-binding universal stress UspA family protein